MFRFFSLFPPNFLAISYLLIVFFLPKSLTIYLDFLYLLLPIFLTMHNKLSPIHFRIFSLSFFMLYWLSASEISPDECLRVCFYSKIEFKTYSKTELEFRIFSLLNTCYEFLYFRIFSRLVPISLTFVSEFSPVIFRNISRLVPNFLA